MQSDLILLVQLFVHPGQETALRQFEQHAAQIMQKYGGRLEHVIHPIAWEQTVAADCPYEIHLVRFPTLEQFEAYRHDPDLAQLLPLREAAIARTEILHCQEAPPPS